MPAYGACIQHRLVDSVLVVGLPLLNQQVRMALVKLAAYC